MPLTSNQQAANHMVIDDFRDPGAAGSGERAAGAGAQLRGLLDGEHDPATLRARIDHLAAELEAHFDYEEAQLVPVLDTA